MMRCMHVYLFSQSQARAVEALVLAKCSIKNLSYSVLKIVVTGVMKLLGDL